uniref:sigma-70 family RNA polymerase sigma factor n=1 Tax=Proteus mirabilis TaxID=584 RepID=UPI001E35AAB9
KRPENAITQTLARQDETLPLDASMRQMLLESDIRQRVIDAIELLPEREKMVLTLYYQEELNLKEIGAVLNVGESRVSQLHSQAIKRLRARLNPEK